MNILDYEILYNMIRPCYRYIEGNDKVEWWVDDQNCWYYTNKKINELNGLYEGKKNCWIISPFKPKGTTLKEEKDEILIKWFVEDSTNSDDIGYLWDFDKNVPDKNNKLKE